MAVSSVGNTYGSVSATRLPSTSCPTCGGTAARSSTAKTYSGFAGRGSDSYVCTTCGQQLTSGQSYCPTCSGNSSVRSSSPNTTNTYGSTYCPTCNKSSAASTARTSAASLSWVR
ncbi:MAG: hypothetical protein LBH00_01080 [Planctomycetaceae bacterium]|nr:hypothetical protein [Planctomycetaceae bacterium]